MHPGLLARRASRAIGAALNLGAAGRRGVSAGLVAAIGLFYVFLIAERRGTSAQDPMLFYAVPIGLAEALLVAAVLWAFFSLPRLLSTTHFILLLTLAVSILLEYMGIPLVGLVLLIAFAALPLALLGAGLMSLRPSARAALSRPQLAAAAIAIALGAAGGLYGLAWFGGDGRASAPTVNAALRATALPPALLVPDPGQRGPHRVLTLAYGSGRDRWRPEFGPQAALLTSPVDGRALVDGWSSFGGMLRTRFWGFDLAQLPLQARVWHPDGPGPFPLVLIVHGSHVMDEFSEPGYAYLGELLASRGFIVASVDENFLNPSASDGLVPWSGGLLRGEVDLRAWLLLEHLRLWRDWNQRTGNPFFRRVDLGNVALIGHSKGGESVALAAAFNRLRFCPDDSKIAFDYGFGIRSVVAIAPTDGLHRPGALPTRLQDINYLALQGANDMDVQSFCGARQFSRVAFSGGDYCLKETVYVHGANHGQFNSVWGRVDHSRSRRYIFNRRPLLPAEQQRQIASVFIGAFLEATLHRDRRYVDFLRDYRRGRDWLPSTILLTDFQDSATRMVSTFEEDIDVTTTTLPGGSISSEGLAVWREGVARIKWGSRDTSVAYVGWDRAAAAAEPSYTLTLPEQTQPLDARSALVFAVADTNERLPSGPRARNEGAPEVIDFSIELADRDGARARLPLGAFSYVQPLLRAQVAKLDCLTDAPGAESTFQSFELPLAAFVSANPRFQPNLLRAVRFVFDRTPRRVLAIDDIGFRGAPVTGS